ncbi:MAG: ABC transporter permease [Xanthobacteraceae bacterium]|nr:ABC transporter permease [Xanthobacteraceae bacterium]
MTASTTLRIVKPHSERTLRDDLASIWTSRELLLVLARREISVRYRQAAIGVLWVVLQPLFTTAIFTIVFVVFARIPNQGESYPLFAFAGLAIWQYFNRAVSDGGNSLVANAALITKVAFPRLIIPLIAPVAGAVDCLIALAVLVIMAVLMGAHVSWMVVLAPLVILAAALLGYSIALWLAPLNAIYRDVGIALPFVMQVAMYMSPIVYPAALVPEKIRWLYLLNPIAVLVDAIRWLVLGTEPPTAVGFTVFGVLTIVLFVGGRRLFRNMEGNLVDRI